MKKLYFSIVFCAISILVDAQKKLDLTLKYDSIFERYEVYVKPNFSQEKFVWGPSQISVVLPSNVSIDKINVKNVDGGTWEDNSVVQSPEANSERSFHGFSTNGDKVNLVENYETILFYFSLPKNINPKEVRLFENESDPQSSDKGMMGGDFKNSIIDIAGNDWFSKVYTYSIIETKEIVDEKYTDFEPIIYPNVITDNKFQVQFKGIVEDTDIMMILFNNKGNELFRKKDRKSILEKQTFILPESARNQSLILKVVTDKGTASKRILSEN
ncbi:hypothetical protein [Emticicia sp. 17c]|uniref:hypothetical protein n=1 Tax=Emticicia sp. 17c TaxID=3127704 RepID=UPI00301D33DA